MKEELGGVGDERSRMSGNEGGRESGVTAHQVFNVPVDVLLHPRRAGGHPAPNSAELKGVWLMAGGEAFVSQLGRGRGSRGGCEGSVRGV